MVSLSGSTGYQCDGAWVGPTCRVVIAIQCTRLQFLDQLASHQTLVVVIVLAFFNRAQKGIPYTAGFRKTLLWERLLTEIREAGFTKIWAQMWIGKENDVRESDE